MVLNIAWSLTNLGLEEGVCIVSGGARFCDFVLLPQRGDYPTTTNYTDPAFSREANILLKSEPGPSPPWESG